MKAMQTRRWTAAPIALAIGMMAGMTFTGCGTPGAPLPPSLKLPDPVTNLTASRTGNQVSLAWTMPKKNTDKLLIKNNIPVRVCRKEASDVCEPLAGNLSFAPDAKATFAETLPPPLASGNARPLTYFVELLSPHGRSAGLSNAAHVLAGEAPAPVAGLSAQLHKEGVVLRWAPDAAGTQSAVVQLHRKLLTPQLKTTSGPKPSPQQGILAPPPEPIDESLLVDSPAQPGKAIDKTILFGRAYEYRAQHVARVPIDGQTVELAGPLSEPIQIETIDVFPPAAPSGLAAVATAADSAAGPSIDLSWLPVPESDLAGYAVYRREIDAANGSWQRISPVLPVIGPAFHDPQVLPGHAYRYAVTAIDHGGRESARSLEAEETVPNP